jgi:hypothetical protein
MRAGKHPGRNGRADRHTEGGLSVKRSILAVGLMSATLPALAAGPDVNLAGTFGISLSWYEQHNDPDIDTTDVDLENNASNFRITAATQEVGIRAFAVYERGASNDQLGVEDVREFFGGVSGQYGTLVAGRKSTEYKLAGSRLDPFYNTSAASLDGRFVAEGASYGLSRLTTGFTPNTVSYTSPVLYGATVNLGGFVHDNDSDDGVGDEADFAVGIGYANSDLWGLDAGVQVLDINGNVVPFSPPGEGSAVRAHVSLGQGLWTVGASFEQIDAEFLSDPRQYAFLSGTYQLFEALRLAATAGMVNAGDDDVATPDGVGGSIGMFWDVTKNLNAYWALRYVGLDSADNEDNATLAAGAKFTFDVDL